jgi:hypothetical protein
MRSSPNSLFRLSNAHNCVTLGYGALGGRNRSACGTFTPKTLPRAFSVGMSMALHPCPNLSTYVDLSRRADTFRCRSVIRASPHAIPNETASESIRQYVHSLTLKCETRCYSFAHLLCWVGVSVPKYGEHPDSFHNGPTSVPTDASMLLLAVSRSQYSCRELNGSSRTGPPARC